MRCFYSVQYQSKSLISTQVALSLGFLNLLDFYCDFMLALFDIITSYFVQAMFMTTMLELTGVELISNIPVLPVSILVILRIEM